ncbi:hypothetical protein Tco_0941938 [Tanacetum coccineum]|uniref:Zinc finger, CCHC-type n=1 Tax=Tanacetum coccineum TaxID=301880 RepID=A0ABQ5DV15_9ASTR
MLTTTGDPNPIPIRGDYSKPSNEGYRNTIELPVGNNVVPLRFDTIRLVQNECSFHGLRSEDPNQHLKDFLKLMDSLDLDGENRERTRLCLFPFSLAIKLATGLNIFQQDLSLHGRILLLVSLLNSFHREGLWNNPRDFAKPVKAISLPQDVPSTSDRHLIELKNQVQRLMEAHHAPTQPTQVNKITTSREICSGPHDTEYCMEDPEQAFVEYASLLTDEAGGNFTYVMDFMIVEDINSIIEISNMTHDPLEGVVRFTKGTDEVAYKMPYKIEQYNSLSDLEKEHMKSVYLINKEDKRKGVEYVMRKILEFYKECLELGPEYMTGMDDGGEVTFLELRFEYSHMCLFRRYGCVRMVFVAFSGALVPESVDVSDESEPEPAKKKTGCKITRGVVIQDTPSALKPKPATSNLKLKGVQSLTPEEQEAADTMQALKESKKTSRRQPGTGASSEGTGRIPRVPDVSMVVSTTSSEGTGTKPWVPDEEKATSEENVVLEWETEHESEHLEDSQLNFNEEEKKDNDGDGDDEDEDDDHVSDSQDTDDEDAETESDKDEIYKYKIQVHKDADVEMKQAETVEHKNKEKVEMTDAVKSDVEKTAEEKDAEINSLLDIKIQFEVPHIQSPYVLTIPISVISEPLVLTPLLETPLVDPATTLLPPPSVSTIPPVLLQTTTPIPTPPITTEAPTITTVVLESNALTDVQLRSQVPMVVEHYLGSKIGDDLQKVLQRHTADLIQKYSVKPALESSKIQIPTIDREQEFEKSASEIRKD